MNKQRDSGQGQGPNSGRPAAGEKELINRICAGERELYRVLVDRYSPMVFHLIRRYVNDEEEVGDMAQEVFVQAWEKLDYFEGRSRFSSWLYTLARNRCLDYVKNIRRKQSRFSDLESGTVEQKLTNEVTPETDMLRKEQWQHLTDAIENLGEDYAVPLMLKYRDGYSYEMISKVTGVSVAALKVRVHRARKEVITSMQTRGED